MGAPNPSNTDAPVLGPVLVPQVPTNKNDTVVSLPQAHGTSALATETVTVPAARASETAPVGTVPMDTTLPPVHPAARPTTLTPMPVTPLRAAGPKPSVPNITYGRGSSRGTTQEQETKKAAAALRASIISEDPLVKLMTGKPDPTATLRAIRSEIAYEVANQKYERQQAEVNGASTFQQSSRRVDALLKLASIEADLAKHGAKTLDMYSPEMAKVLELFVTALRDAAAEVLTPEQVDLLFNRLETALTGWEERAESALR